MQREMVSIMSRVDSRDVDLVDADSEATALVNRVKQATPFHVSNLRCARTTTRHPSDEADRQRYRPKPFFFLIQSSKAVA